MFKKTSLIVTFIFYPLFIKTILQNIYLHLHCDLHIYKGKDSWLVISSLTLSTDQQILFQLIFYFQCLPSKGDSGGPLVGLISNANVKFPHYVLVGVVSYGPKQCGFQGIPGVYTR